MGGDRLRITIRKIPHQQTRQRHRSRSTNTRDSSTSPNAVRSGIRRANATSDTATRWAVFFWSHARIPWEVTTGMLASAYLSRSYTCWVRHPCALAANRCVCSKPSTIAPKGLIPGDSQLAGFFPDGIHIRRIQDHRLGALEITAGPPGLTGRSGAHNHSQTGATDISIVLIRHRIPL
jgi:hypothetical protein